MAHRLQAGLRLLVPGLWLLLSPGCTGLHVYQAPVRARPVDPALSPVGRALAYLDQTQVKTLQQPLAGGADFPGNWPQYVTTSVPVRQRVREVSPFLPAFIHHALALIVEENQSALGLDTADLARARALRQAAVDFMQRFAVAPDAPEAGAYGFWPARETSLAWRKPWLSAARGDWLAAPAFWLFMGGPALRGPLTCLNVPQMPAAFGIHPDADDTAVIWAARLDGQRLDGGPRPEPLLHLFERWRDTGAVRLRHVPDWRPEASGVFLTYFGPGLNDVDLAVNANVLYLLGRLERLDVAGAEQAQELIRNVVPGWLAGEHQDGLDLYYPNPMMAYHCLARAYAEGPVPDLAPAIRNVADEIQQRSRREHNGAVYWNFGQPDLDTALGVLVLLNANRHLDLVPGAIRYLLDCQDPRHGSWREGCAFGGTTARGVEIRWESAPFTTAMGLEALCRFVLAAPDMDDPAWAALAGRITAPP